MYILYWHNVFLYLWGEARGRVEPAKKSHRTWISAVSVFCPALKNNFTTLRHALSMSSPPPLLVYSPLFHFHTHFLSLFLSLSFSLAKLQNWVLSTTLARLSFSLPKFWRSILSFTPRVILLPLCILATYSHSSHTLAFFIYTFHTRLHSCEHTYKLLQNHIILYIRDVLRGYTSVRL